MADPAGYVGTHEKPLAAFTPARGLAWLVAVESLGGVEPAYRHVGENHR